MQIKDIKGLYFWPVAVAQIFIALPLNVILFYVNQLLRISIVVTCFQLALLSHLLPAFEIVFSAASNINYLSIILSDYSTESGSATCTPNLQYDYLLNYDGVTQMQDA